MSVRKLLSNVMPRRGIKNILSDVFNCLDHLPSLQKKLDVFFMGAELLLYLQEDNDLGDFLAGRIVLSQSTVTRILNRVLERVPGVNSASVMVREGYILCNIDTDKGPGGLQISIKLGNVQLFTEHKTLHVKVDILEFPVVRPRISLAAFFCSACMYILKKTAGTERIYRRVARDIPGLAVDGNTLIFDLMQIPGVEDKLSREMFGIRLLEVFNVDRVELRNGEVRIYGGPRIPEKFIRKAGAVQ